MMPGGNHKAKKVKIKPELASENKRSKCRSRKFSVKMRSKKWIRMQNNLDPQEVKFWKKVKEYQQHHQKMIEARSKSRGQDAQIMTNMRSKEVKIPS